MKLQAAVAIAEKAKQEIKNSVDYEFRSANRVVIEQTQNPDDSQPSPVRDRLVWLVRFGRGDHFIEIAVDYLSGKVARVDRSG